MPYDETSAEAEAGRRGEAAVDEWTRRLGWARLMVSDWGRKAVFTDADGKTHAAFDRLYMIPKGSRWVDVKWKTAPIIYGVQDVQRHGIDYPAWLNYCKMVDVSGIPGDLAVIEVKRHRNAQEIAPILRWQSLSVLKERIYSPHHQIKDHPIPNFPYGAIFWDVADFDDCGTIGIGNFPLPTTRLNLHPWEGVDRFGKLRIPKVRPMQMEFEFSQEPQGNPG